MRFWGGGIILFIIFWMMILIYMVVFLIAAVIALIILSRKLWVRYPATRPWIQTVWTCAGAVGGIYVGHGFATGAW